MTSVDRAPHVFVGESRRRVRDALAAAFDEVRNGSGSRVAVLVSQPGWGKTRIVQELYRLLAADQSQPAYWPPTILDQDAGAAPDQTLSALSRARKSVYPTRVTVASGAQMDWMWWGVLCHQRSHGQLAQAMFDDAVQLYAHADALMRDPIDQVGGRAFDAGSTVIGVLGLLGLAVAPPVGAAITLVGAAKIGWDNRDVLDRLRDWWSDNRGKDDGRLVASDSPLHREDELGRLVEGLGRLTRVRPMVVAVDDAHFADETLVRVVDGLVRDDGARVLVVATAWPSHLDASEDALPFAVWAQSLAAERSDRYLRFDLDELADGDIEEVVRAELPTAEGFGERVKELYGANLLAIRGVLRLPRVRRLAETGELDMRALGKLPRDIEAVFAEHWAGLPDGVQQVLALAAQPEGARYLPQLVAAVCETHGLVESARLRLSEGVSPYAWAREIDESLHTFVEPVLHEIARGRADELLTEEEIDALSSAVVDAALRIDTLDLSPSAHLELLEEYVALVENGSAPAASEAVGSALELAVIHASRYGYARAIELGRLAIAWSGLPDDDPDILETRAALARWLADAGRADEAARQFEGLLADQRRVLGPDHADTLSTRNNLAVMLGRIGRLEDATRQLDGLLADRLRLLGPDDPDPLTTRNNLAVLLGQAGLLEEAIGQFEQLVADQVRVLGPDDPDTLGARSNLVVFLGMAGRLEEGIGQTEQLLTHHLRLLGPDDPDTLATRATLASLLGMAGRGEEAVTQSAELLTDRLRVLGAEHPDTLATRHELAHLVGEAGHAEAAARLFDELLADRLRVLGPDHPDTLVTRHELAHCLGEAGDAETAARRFEELLADRLRLQGPDHPDTLSTRHELAAWVGEAGRVEEAIARLDELFADRLRLLGSDHPDTLQNRSLLVSLLGVAGRVEEATSQLEELLADRLRVLGPAHPDTMETRNAFASSLSEAGRPEEAAGQLEALLAEQLQLLGSDHPDTLATRTDFAASLGAADRIEEATRQYEELLSGFLRVVGPDHRHTLMTRSILATYRGAMGRPDRAAHEFEELLADHVRLFGPDHPDTLETRHELATWLADAGRLDEARAGFEQLQADQLRVLGPDHPDTLATREEARRIGG